jgi:hypothetical protein
MTTDPKQLPLDHPLRNQPLGEIKAEVRNMHKEDWRPITAAWTIAKNTFNYWPMARLQRMESRMHLLLIVVIVWFVLWLRRNYW